MPFWPPRTNVILYSYFISLLYLYIYRYLFLIFTDRWIDSPPINGPVMDDPWKKSQASHPFLRGPIPLKHLEASIDISPGALQVSLALWHQAALLRRTHELRLTASTRKIWRLKHRTISRAVADMERDGLIISTKKPGCLTEFQLISPKGFFTSRSCEVPGQ